MFKFVKLPLWQGFWRRLPPVLVISKTKNNCSYDYLLHPAISISKIIGGCGPAADQ